MVEFSPLASLADFPGPEAWIHLTEMKNKVRSMTATDSLL